MISTTPPVKEGDRTPKEQPGNGNGNDNGNENDKGNNNGNGNGNEKGKTVSVYISGLYAMTNTEYFNIDFFSSLFAAKDDNGNAKLRI